MPWLPDSQGHVCAVAAVAHLREWGYEGWGISLNKPWVSKDHHFLKGEFLHVHCKFGRSKSDLTWFFGVGVAGLRSLLRFNTGLIGAYPSRLKWAAKAKSWSQYHQAILHSHPPIQNDPWGPQIPKIQETWWTHTSTSLQKIPCPACGLWLTSSIFHLLYLDKHWRFSHGE